MGFFRRQKAETQAQPQPTATTDASASAANTANATAGTAAGAAGMTSTANDGSASGDVALPGVTLHYATWGTPNPERVVLLVHGLTASHKEWPMLAPALAAAGHYVVAPDLRGRGLSSKPAQGYGVAFHAADLLALCTTLGFASVDVVGHSLGAVIGMYMAALYPQRVRRLVMVDAGGNIPEDTAQAIGASVSRLGTVHPSLDAYLNQMRQLPMFAWSDAWEDYFRYDADVRADGTVVSRVPKAAIEEESLALALTRSEALPDLVRAPTLILRATVGLLGPDRGLILPREEAERLHGIIPASQFREIEGTNHYTIVHSDEFVQAVATFLA